MEAVADAAGEEGVEEEEEGEDEVGEVGRGKFELFAEPGTHFDSLVHLPFCCSGVVTWWPISCMGVDVERVGRRDGGWWRESTIARLCALVGPRTGQNWRWIGLGLDEE